MKYLLLSLLFTTALLGDEVAIPIIRAIAAPPSGVTGTYTDYVAAGALSSGANSITNVDIGTADATRQVLVAIHNRPATVSAVTIGGISASQIVAASASGSPSMKVEFWKAEVPTGTTATVAFTLSEGATYLSIGVWSVVGASTTVLDFGSDIDTTSENDDMTSVAGGFVVAAVTAGNDAPSATWTFDGNSAEDYDVDPLESADDTVSAASYVATDTLTSVGVTGVGGSNFVAVVYVSFGPL